MELPQTIVSRKNEIARDFFALLDTHIQDILQGKAVSVYRIRDFAEKLHIHPTHFSNTIKLVTGKSPCDFVEERIMVEANRLLAETSLPIKDICYRLTFQEPTNFTKFYKAMAGITPSQYRKQKTENLTFSGEQ